MTATSGHQVLSIAGGTSCVIRPVPRAGRPDATGPDVPCRHDPDLFFAEAPEDIRLAKLLCASCPMRAACLAGALHRGEPWGVWGGALFDHGIIIADKRRRGRPRKLTAAAPSHAAAAAS